MQEENIFYTVEMQREVRDFVANLEKELADYPPLYERDIVQVRKEQEEGTGRYVKPVLSDKAIEREIQGSEGTVTVRAFIPEDQINGVYLHIHGGGWVLGRAHHRDDDLEEIMSDCNAAVISVDYRLAPEHPYPACLLYTSPSPRD